MINHNQALFFYKHILPATVINTVFILSIIIMKPSCAAEHKPKRVNF